MFGGTNYYCEAQTNTYRKQRKINRAEQRKMMKNIGQTSNKINNISQRLNPGVEEKLLFPDLILYYGSAKFNRSFYFLKLSFDQANYPLEVEVTKLAGEFNVRLMSGWRIISQAKGMTLKVAKQCAVVDAMKRLQCTNYAIEVKQNYFNPKKYPDFLQHIDPSLSHVYKVVYLKKSVDEGPVFPHRLTGAVDYVFDELELSSYIKDHCKSTSNADLYVLNINKALRKWLRKMGTINGGWQHRNVTNCGDRGSCLEPPLNIRRIFTDLQDCGGETIKHLIIPPGSENIVTFEEKMSLEGSQQTTTPKARCQFGEQQISQKVHDVYDNQAGKVRIDPWICKHLIIVEFMTENNQLGTAKELIFQAVKQCPMLEEFIVEKKRDKYSNILLAEAMIDRMVVGRSVGIQKCGVKNVACTDALENLKKNCIYIKAKNTYFGHESGPENIPDFLTGPVQQTNLYRIISPYNVRSLSECENLFKNFRNQAIEDLFFKSFPSHEMEAMIDLARRMNLPVRTFGKDWFCVTKKINPREIFKALSNCGGENEKYKLIIPDRLETEKKQLSEKPFLNNMFGIKSERDTFQRSSGHKKIINASENFDVGNSMKSNYNSTSSSICNESRSGNLVYNIEKDNVNIKKNLSNLFDVPSNINQESSKSLPTDQLSDNIDISEHNLLKKERIVISTNSYPPEKTGNIGLSQQSDEIRKKSIYDHGDDVWLDDIEDPREVPLHVESLNQEKRASWATPFVPQQLSAEQKEDANYYHNEGRVKDYNHGRPLQYNNFSNSKSQQRLDDDHVSSGVSKRHVESTKIYDQQRYDEPPNKVARLFTSPWSIDEMRRKKDCNVASVEEEDYYQENSYYPSHEPNHNLRNSNLGNLSRQAEMNNTYSQQPNNYYKDSEIYPSRNKISNEPPNKVAKLFEFDPQFQGSGVQRYDNLNQQPFAQSRSLGQPCRVQDDGEMSIHKDNYHQAKSSISGSYDRKQHSYLNDSSFGCVTRKLEEFTGSQSTIKTDALSKTPDASCVSEDRDYFSAQSKRASNHQRMSSREFVPVKVVDYAEQNDRIIDHQNNSRAEESFYSRGSSQHPSDWKSDERLYDNRKPQYTSNISHPTDHSRVSSTKRSELELLSSQNRNDDIHSFTNQRSSTHVSKLFDLTDSSKESTSQYSIESSDRFSRGYSDSFNGNTSGLYNDSFNRPASTYSKSSEFRTGITKPSTQNKHETGKLWKKNVKKLFDQRKNY